MAKLPSFRKIYEQDYDPQYQELIRQLSVSLNYGIEVLYQLLNGKLTVKDNLASTVKELNVQVDSTGKPLTSSTIKKSSTDRIEGLIVVRAENLTNSNTYPTSGIFISYTETNENIVINNIKGLTANDLWKINVIALR